MVNTMRELAKKQINVLKILFGILSSDYKCGMRRPSSGHNDGDLSHLTSTSSPADNSSLVAPSHRGSIVLVGDDTTTNTPNSVPICDGTEFNSNYLPRVIDPAEWTIPRKRKERQDSTSSITQDRKLVRSNSEECLPCAGFDILRKVSSHDDFKKALPFHENNDGNIVRVSGVSAATSHHRHHDCTPDNETATNVDDVTNQNECGSGGGGGRNIDYFRRQDSSPARSRTYDYSQKNRLSPHRFHHHHGRRDSEDVDGGEHERRRSSERFAKTRAPPGRKSASPRKPGSKTSSDMQRGRGGVETLYRYNIVTMKYERRNFDEKSMAHGKKDTTTPDDDSSDYNDNNLVDVINDENRAAFDIKPWDISFQDDMPVVCQRFADHTFDYVTNSRHTGGNNGPPLPAVDLIDANSLIDNENVKTRDLMQKVPATNVFLSPDERVKQINKRLVSLKKKVNAFEEHFEKDYGYRPSQAEKNNDKSIKHAIAEIHKLRKEKQHIRCDPVTALRAKSGSTGSVQAGIGENGGSATAADQGDKMKLVKMKETLLEIEKRLQTKRTDAKRSLKMDEMTSNDLTCEKTAIQKSLLYLESVYGRPSTRDERDAARPLYDRYRQVKRMVNRISSASGSGLVAMPELPTILEHEALAFTSSTAVTPSAPSLVESPSDTSTSVKSTTDSTTDTSSSIHENVHTMSLDELWQELSVAREDKKQLRRIIKEFEHNFEELNGRKMLKTDRKDIEDTYALYKQKKAKLRLLDALVKKHLSK